MGAVPESDDSHFASIGNFSPPEAQRLFDALEQAAIDFRAKFDDGIDSSAIVQRSFGLDAQIDVFVDPEKLAEAEAIRRSLFGDFGA